MKLNATYAGVVESTTDPERVGRLKVRVPSVYGPASTTRGSIQTNDLPWALPAGLPAGGSAASGAIGWLPAVGDHVYVRFLDGEPEKPVWEWGGQDVNQASSFPYWRRNPGGYTDKAAPDSAYLTRYGHAVEFSPTALFASTGKGYNMLLDNGTGTAKNGSASLTTSKGYTLEFSDRIDTGLLSVPHMTAYTRSVYWTTDTFDTLSKKTWRVKTANAYFESPKVRLGTNASDPVVRKSDLDLALATIMEWANSHTHGGQTATPTLTVVATASQVTTSA